MRKKTLEIEKALAAKKHIGLSYSIDADISVVADEHMLQLVVRNIVSNAIKFTPQGGLIKVSAEVTDDMCKITVADNGTGMDAEKQEQLFSMTSGPTFGTDNEKGVGLGLSLCKEFMEWQGGHIAVESMPGMGSSFYINIPVSQTVT